MKMAELLRVFREGVLQEEALRRVYGFGLEELDAQWRQSLGLKPRPTPGPTVEAAKEQAEREGEARGPGSGFCFPNLLLTTLGLMAPIAWRLARTEIDGSRSQRRR